MSVAYLEQIADHGSEEVVFVSHSSGLRAIIAVHSTLLGPALGGIRRWHYRDEADALTDVLRLSRAMTYKNALAGIAFGGGKAVMLDRDGDLRSQFVVLGEAIERLSGRYIAAEDVGTTLADMAIVSRSTSHVVGIDPSPYTALGVVAAARAACLHVFGSATVQARTVAVQGAGKVGKALCRLLANEGATVRVHDIDSTRSQAVAGEHPNIKAVGGTNLLAAPVDIFIPCGLGEVIDTDLANRIDCKIICGAANNQLKTSEAAEVLLARGITYVPDYLANSGGVIAFASGQNGDPGTVRRAVEALEQRVRDLLTYATTERIGPARAADLLAEKRLSEAAVAVASLT
jgi:glutamate dehydrogenase/leucine dehydrogenase